MYDIPPDSRCYRRPRIGRWPGATAPDRGETELERLAVLLAELEARIESWTTVIVAPASRREPISPGWLPRRDELC